MHIQITPKVSGPTFVVCGRRPSGGDISIGLANTMGKEMMLAFGVCETCVRHLQQRPRSPWSAVERRRLKGEADEPEKGLKRPPRNKEDSRRRRSFAER
jgi:hypothetical protein